MSDIHSSMQAAVEEAKTLCLACGGCPLLPMSRIHADQPYDGVL
jgi:hypothetical protein